MSEIINLPPLQLSFSRKNKAWRKKHLDWAEQRTFFNHSLVRKSTIHKKINYDLLIGKLHMDDLLMILNPESILASYIPERIQHYPIMNSKLNVLRGEESKRVFDFRVVVTNPNSISEIENNKKLEVLARLQLLVSDQSLSEELFNLELDRMNEFFTYEWLDMREVRANALINHYIKELNMLLLFNDGFMDAMAVGEEIYQCDIIGGEPSIRRIDPIKIRVFRSGYSNKIEDADIIVIEDYWNPGRVIDTFYDSLSKKDLEYLENASNGVDKGTDSMDNIDETRGLIDGNLFGDLFTSLEGFFWDPIGTTDSVGSTLLPFDVAGNVRVILVYWKSKRKIKKVKSYDPLTGEETFSFYPETYVLNEELGEEEEIYYINEAWEGTKIGEKIYVNMHPRPVLYNRLTNPSRCHFGIIGAIYNLNGNKPFSLVDMMKPYNYLYDVIHDRLNKLIAKNWGKIMTLDLAKVPTGWDIDKWMYFAKTNNLAVVDSFKEGNRGAAMGKLAGGLNNASSGVIDAELGNSIQLYVNLLEYIKQEMSDVAGISKQREGQISNRETVGGVERATLLSSHITEWLFLQHDDVKKRTLECLLETAKIALRGRNKKFQYILSDGSLKVMEIEGDEFAESDYGLVVDNSQGTLELAQKLETLAQAALLTLALNFSTIMKLYLSTSLIEKQRMVEKAEADMLLRQQEAQQQQMLMQQQLMEAEAQAKQAEMEMRDALNQRDNETRIIVAEINSKAEADRLALMNQDPMKEALALLSHDELLQRMKEFDAKLKLDKEKLEFERLKHKEDNLLKDTISKRLASKKATSK